jgi:hypothetical protein
MDAPAPPVECLREEPSTSLLTPVRCRQEKTKTSTSSRQLCPLTPVPCRQEETSTSTTPVLESLSSPLPWAPANTPTFPGLARVKAAAAEKSLLREVVSRLEHGTNGEMEDGVEVEVAVCGNVDPESQLQAAVEELRMEVPGLHREAKVGEVLYRVLLFLRFVRTRTGDTLRHQFLQTLEH